MGHSSCGSHGRRTCDKCDACPTCDGLGRLSRKACPVNWCGTVYLCAPCARQVGALDHADCRRRSDAYHAEKRQQDEATANGAPVIKAGVRLPSGRVFAWTTTRGNFEVDRDVYRAGLERADKVLDITGATPRAEEYPPEVYGRAGA
jgi:hypothetical protein